MATNIMGDSLPSTSSPSVTLPNVPDAPTNLAVSVQGQSIALSWSTPSNDGGSTITDYNIEYQLSTGGTWAVFADGNSTATTTIVTGLSNNTSYDFRVSAINAVGQSVPSNVVTAIPGEPAQVLIQNFPDLTAESIGTAVRITNEGTSQYEYQYTWCVTDSQANQCGSGDDIFSSTAAKLIQSGENFDTILNSIVATPGSYWFHIKVTYGSQSSFAEQSFNVVATYPDVPTIGTATAGNASAIITFTAPASNGGSAISTYTATSNPGGITGTGTISPITVTGLTNGTAYTFTVTATNTVGTSSASASSNSVTPVTIPDQPTGLVAIAGNAQVKLSWMAPASDGGSVITDYVIEYKPSSDQTWIVFADGISASTVGMVTGLSNGTSYDFRVSAINAVGQSLVNAISGTSPVNPNHSSQEGGGGGGSIGGAIFVPLIENPKPNEPKLITQPASPEESSQIEKLNTTKISTTKPTNSTPPKTIQKPTNEVQLITPTQTLPQIKTSVSPTNVFTQSTAPLKHSQQKTKTRIPWIWVVIGIDGIIILALVIPVVIAIRKERKEEYERERVIEK